MLSQFLWLISFAGLLCSGQSHVPTASPPACPNIQLKIKGSPTSIVQGSKKAVKLVVRLHTTLKKSTLSNIVLKLDLPEHGLSYDSSATFPKMKGKKTLAPIEQGNSLYWMNIPLSKVKPRYFTIKVSTNN